MSGFTKTVSKAYQFDGDTIEVIFQPFTRGDMLKLSPVLPKASKNADGDIVVEGSIDLSKSMEMMEIAAEVMSPHIVKFEGLQDIENKALTKEDMLNANYFISLSSEILTDMMNASFLKEEETKN